MEPLDPFSEQPSMKITFSELLKAPYIREAYKNVTRRTLSRELFRLSEFGFIKFSVDAETKEPVIEMDFDAIGKY